MFLAAVVKAHLPPLPEGVDSGATENDSDSHERETTDSEARAVSPSDQPVPARARWL
jgi:hypothetical protein